MEVDRNGLEVLGREECLHLLAGETLGRLALTSGALPMVFPVNFHFDGEQILVKTGRGTKLDAAIQNAVVAFEVDDFDPMYHSGWSVVVTGRSREIAEPDQLDALRAAPLARWAPRGNGRIMAISTEMVSGRCIVPGLAPPGGTAA